ncbi:DUF6869 domain-containing protein [Marilutibacter chinensis]|uniref:DUF6869 domain-containing protein n=1 Tax=Marilutibacter chinensis TaxID=2912247 RepID=A0ABS9HVL0_9GAMM|nr:hypothetical protein [Lysobacter chinensis]MCF7222931.1 hypothetical protein [Lysobacter chinensis]
MDSYDRYLALGRPIDYLMECWARSWSPDPVEKEEYGWAYVELLDGALDDPERVWQCILCALANPVFSEHFPVLAAGPLEDLLSHHGPDFIDRVEALAGQSSTFASLLGGVWRFEMSDDVWARVQKARDGRGWDDT